MMSSGQIQVKQADQVVHNFDNQYARTEGKRMSSVEKNFNLLRYAIVT